jgi:hypothetical protein
VSHRSYPFTWRPTNRTKGPRQGSRVTKALLRRDMLVAGVGLTPAWKNLCGLRPGKGPTRALAGPPRDDAIIFGDQVGKSRRMPIARSRALSAQWAVSAGLTFYLSALPATAQQSAQYMTSEKLYELCISSMPSDKRECVGYIEGIMDAGDNKLAKRHKSDPNRLSPSLFRSYSANWTET